jgi:hypothetical protein
MYVFGMCRSVAQIWKPDSSIDAKPGCSTAGHGYGASCVLAGIDELGERIIDIFNP